jgi:hypothetical protein
VSRRSIGQGLFFARASVIRHFKGFIFIAFRASLFARTPVPFITLHRTLCPADDVSGMRGNSLVWDSFVGALCASVRERSHQENDVFAYAFQRKFPSEPVGSQARIRIV